MWLDSSAKLLRNLSRYEKRRNKKPKIKVQYIQFSNKSIPHKESGMLRRNRRTGIERRRSTRGWLMLAGIALAALVIRYVLH